MLYYGSTVLSYACVFELREAVLELLATGHVRFGCSRTRMFMPPTPLRTRWLHALPTLAQTTYGARIVLLIPPFCARSHLAG